ncbi:hypothetical protein [Sphingobium yanoikuyae]|uniref:hypothetical protein n=1 Tax=Sphingobium yanoikuyae TaxID=13690 RepID=UPI000F7E93EF|nr:hypothetical protein [Sphingobium yanoikuyae]
MKSPFEDLQIDSSLVYEFVAAFMRFEYAMKATDYCRQGNYNNAEPNWNDLKTKLGPLILDSNPKTKAAVRYLNRWPPKVQKYESGQAIFREVPLVGETNGGRAIEAAKRVRNNLFHGGKHTAHSKPKRDENLIRCAIKILDACLENDAVLKTEFDHQTF